MVTIGGVNGARPARHPDREPTSAVAMAIAGLGPIRVAAALVSVRGHLVNVNVALVLVVVVVLAAVAGGRAAGALAAVMAALSYEFFSPSRLSPCGSPTERTP